MVSELALKIIKNAAQIRLSRNELLDDIIASYPKLSDEQAEQLRSEFTPSEEEK